MPMTTSGAPTARIVHTAVWTGREMIVWGGNPNMGQPVNDGGVYQPAANSWTTVTAGGAPAGRRQHTAVWSGSEMVLWGGIGGGGVYNDTFSFTPGRVLYLYQRP
jgi:hypothetical protein